MGYGVSAQEVADFHNSTARRRVVSAPARTSKSYAAARDIVPMAIPKGVKDKKGRIVPERSTLSWSVGPDYSTNKEFFYWFEEIVEKDLFKALGATVTKAHNSPNQGNMVIVAEWGRGLDGRIVRSVMEGKSATNERALQGEEVDNLIMSEAASQEARIWNRYLRTRYGNAVFPTTPRVSAEWLYDMILEGEENDASGIESFTFTPRANPEYDWERFWTEHATVERANCGWVRTDPGGHDCLIYEDGRIVVNPVCEAAKDPWFAEQNLGQWTFQEGRVLPFVWREGIGGLCHVVAEEPEWLPEAQFFWSFDYGYDHPYVGGLWAVSPTGQLYLHDSFYESHLSDDDVIERVKSRNEKLAEEWGGYPDRYSGDPKRPQVGRLLADRGFPVVTVDKNKQSDRAAGHKAIVNHLRRVDAATGLPGLIVHARNTAIIREWTRLRVKDGSYANEWGTTSLSGADHGFDMAKYGVFVADQMIRTASTRHEGDWLREFKRIRRRVLGRPTNAPPLAGGNPSMIAHA